MSINIYEQEQTIKFETYDFLMETYIDIINKLINISNSFNILPFKLTLCINYIKKYINENRYETLQNGLNYLLVNKEIILSFDMKNLDELDMDSDDNLSVKSCVNNFKKSSSNTQINYDPDGLLDLMIEIKNNAKKLKHEDINIIKKHFELIIMILEEIKKLFL